MLEKLLTVRQFLVFCDYFQNKDFNLTMFKSHYVLDFFFNIPKT